MTLLFQSKLELIGFISGLLAFVLGYQDIIKIFQEIMFWVSGFTALISLAVMLEKYTELDIPFINVEKSIKKSIKNKDEES